jgi:AraC-like DNA-binding protein
MVVEEHIRVTPSPHVRRFAAYYSGYRSRGAAPAVHRGLPSPYLTLILTLDEPLTMAKHLDPAAGPSNHDALLGGMHDRPVYVTHDGNQSGIQIGLEPLAVRALLGVPAGELWCLDLDPSDVFGSWVDGVRERLLAATDWPSRFAVVDDMLLRAERAALGRRAPASDEVRHVWRRLLTSGGRSRIGDLALETGWSERHLTARFTAEMGARPKQAARLIRFHLASRAVAASAASGRGTLAGIAADTGYYDQSHLDRDFTEFAGCCPSAWVAEEFGNIQAGAYRRAAGSQS